VGVGGLRATVLISPCRSEGSGARVCSIHDSGGRSGLGTEEGPMSTLLSSASDAPDVTPARTKCQGCPDTVVSAEPSWKRGKGTINTSSLPLISSSAAADGRRSPRKARKARVEKKRGKTNEETA
jgi:hypothetical protein